ncbi:21811_t:CDS:2 [Entrophospora sp. SA101]|nr:21811_t:CDS:2 [Entrophospora sp. SA101]CAJ0860094.1 3462_t:CDS:2 [Entrophospora sp. SA101]CAJ0864513.1 15282_t:CDS:2 [Entrophospora sp. SA101]
MRASKLFLNDLKNQNLLDKGHGTPDAVLMGMEGETPEDIDTTSISSRINEIHEKNKVKEIHFNPKKHLIFHYDKSLPKHPNGLRFSAFNNKGDYLANGEFYSIGGGFIIKEITTSIKEESTNHYYKANAEELLEVCNRENLSISQVVYKNELQWHQSHNHDDISGENEINKKITKIWETMDQSIIAGCLSTEEYLPGSIKVKRRAPGLYKQLMIYDDISSKTLDFLSVYAIAVNEENAAGGRVVTAPTNGAAGIIPAVLKFYLKFISKNPRKEQKYIMEYLFTCAAIGMLYKKGASISAAEMGCQGEVGVACSMSAAGFAALMGATPEQVENAAEIGMEHNLGLTCDPVNGLVQIPCIERNALGAVKAVTAAQLALKGDGNHRVTLDQVIETMRQTGHDMQTKYKETSLGGLAVNVPIC